LGPLQTDVGNALDAFAKALGITMVIDGSQVPGVIYAADYWTSPEYSSLNSTRRIRLLPLPPRNRSYSGLSGSEQQGSCPLKVLSIRSLRLGSDILINRPRL
jgi:hypothetical protein